MLFFYLSEVYAPWLAPYAYGIVLLGFLLFLFRFFENLYAAQFNKPLFRHYFIYKKLSAVQLSILTTEFNFYNLLTKKQKQQFEHRVAHFISEKRFIGRDNLIVTERMSVLIAAVGCMLSFGRKNYSYSLINVVLIYPDQFFSVINNNYHKGEFNPKEKALVFSWSDFENGFKITNDNLNVGIHEFMHAMQLEAKTSRDLDSLRFSKHFQNILKQLTLQNVKDKIDKTAFFRAYAFSNQYEFMAVLAEYFFESPTEFKSQFPKIYDYTKKLLNFNFAQY
ncbi:zinc-dependent peptidase [Aequorivita sp. F47161]|uniref:Zinc-dependent peptidase n=1 Tax=Aequorivita vitellina TaxID=2874475 RepID=A0A9X1QVN7_9FLAO|nr:zinc-dependent peptidase [Aequorivita vitellina]MCG2418227.1 zinc-dependent peptidase [Aequorivita vitellina]